VKVNRPNNPSGNLVELQGDELEELIEVDGPAADPYASAEPFAETQAIHAPQDLDPPSMPAYSGHQTGPGSASFPDTPPERTERMRSSPYADGRESSRREASERDSRNSGPYASDRFDDPFESSPFEPTVRAPSSPSGSGGMRKARTADLHKPRRGSASGSRPKKRISTEDSIDEMLGVQLGSYRILSLIGEGGMGRVYQAEHVKLGRKVALKLLRAEYSVKRDAVARFFQEARAVNQIGHENIVDITDFVELDGGETYIIMELLQGEDLADIQRKCDQPMPLHRAMQISLQVCDALEAAHKAGIVHRDLKPDNIFIVNEGNKRDFVKLLDFGVAKLLGVEDSRDGWKTAAGSVIGTPAYMSPEQASGIPVDHRSDMYSLGAILYELFTGHPVFRAKSFGEFVVKHMNHDPIPPRELADAPSIPAALEAVILRCLEKDPAARYQSVAELREDLARATATVETVVGPVTVPRTRGRSRRGLILVVVVLSVAVMAGAAFWIAAGGLSVEAPPDNGTFDPSTATRATASPMEPSGEPGAVVTAKLTLRSNPSGASVFRRDDPTASLGQTPLVVNLENIGEEVEFLFRLEGYKDGETRVTVANNTIINVDLEEIDTPPTPTPPAQVKRTTVKHRPPVRRRSRTKTKVRPKAKIRIKTKTQPPVPPAPRVKKKHKINPGDVVDPFKLGQ
jgi:serine/threonine-protein kinase